VPGVLCLILERGTYEKAGLTGKPYGPKATAGVRPQWIIEFNLRNPSMLHGKKGFDRLIHACKTVLTEPVTWLFTDLGGIDSATAPIERHFPVTSQCSVLISSGPKVKIPEFQPPLAYDLTERDTFSDFSVTLYEWLSLISLESPRLDVNDNNDTFLSRYTPPSSNQLDSQAKQVIRITWEGFFPASWVYDTFVKIMRTTSSKEWFSFGASGFGNDVGSSGRDFKILKLPASFDQFVLWEVF